MATYLFVAGVFFALVALGLLAYIVVTYENMPCEVQKETAPRITWPSGIAAFFCGIIAMLLFGMGAREMCDTDKDRL